MPPKLPRLKRVRAGIYQTPDGVWEVWQEDAYNASRYGCPRRWFVNHKDFDETLHLVGFHTKREAVVWLARTLTEDWWKDDISPGA